MYDEDRKRIAERIERGYFAEISVGDGWMPLIIELDKKLAELVPDYRIEQVKEKFGGLRYYTDVPYDSEANKLIDQAEADSYRICENCGKPGEQTNSGGYWTKTLCPDCDSERSERG